MSQQLPKPKQIFGAPRTVPLVQVLVINFSPTRIATLWHAAAGVLPAIELRLYCRTHGDIDAQSTLADHYDILIVDVADHDHWMPRLESPALRSLLQSTVIISGEGPATSIQSTLLRAGYADVVCVQDDHARTIVSATIKAYLRQLRMKQIELPSAIAAPIQRALV